MKCWTWLIIPHIRQWKLILYYLVSDLAFCLTLTSKLKVIEHKPYGDKADVFSFGVVLWELLTGKVNYTEIVIYLKPWLSFCMCSGTSNSFLFYFYFSGSLLLSNSTSSSSRCSTKGIISCMQKMNLSCFFLYTWEGLGNRQYTVIFRADIVFLQLLAIWSSCWYTRFKIRNLKFWSNDCTTILYLLANYKFSGVVLLFQRNLVE